MKFNPTHKPEYSGLPAPMAVAAETVFYQRRAAGLNVQFMNAGKLDEWSFATVEQRDKLVSRLSRDGAAFALSRS
jgi:hypothetical protein